MEIEELFGLPAHPLVVHAAVVLLPLAAMATIVCAPVRPGTSSRSATAAVLALSLIAGVGATWTVVDVGHSGAKASWSDVGAEADD